MEKSELRKTLNDIPLQTNTRVTLSDGRVLICTDLYFDPQEETLQIQIKGLKSPVRFNAKDVSLIEILAKRKRPKDPIAKRHASFVP